MASLARRLLGVRGMSQALHEKPPIPEPVTDPFLQVVQLFFSQIHDSDLAIIYSYFFSEISLAKPPRSPRDLLLREAFDGARDATFHHSFPEVQQATKSHFGELEVGQELLLVGIGDPLDGLQFEGDPILNDNVGAKPYVEAFSPTLDGN